MWELREPEKKYVWNPEASDKYVGAQVLTWAYDYRNSHYPLEKVSEEQISEFIKTAKVKEGDKPKLKDWFDENGDGQGIETEAGWKMKMVSGKFSTLKDYNLVPPDNKFIAGKRGRAPESGEYIEKFDEQDRKAISKEMMEKGMPGACEPWTLGWIEEGIEEQKPRTKWYGKDEIMVYIERMAEKVKAMEEAEKKKPPEYVPGHMEEKRKTGELVDIDRGPIEWSGYEDMETVKGLQGIGRVLLVPGNYYTFELNKDAEKSGGGHVFAMYQDRNELIVFDQNYGLLQYAGGLPRMVEVVEAELNLLRHQPGIWRKMGGWRISRYQPVGS